MTELKSSVTHVDGVEVIAREPAMGPHPRWGKERMVPRTGVVRVLLADNTERFICEEGDFSADTALSVVSHRNGTHRRIDPHRPIYDLDVIRTVIREVKRAKAAGHRGYCERAAAALNDAHVPTVQGSPWTPAAVSNIYNAYKDKYRVTLRERERATPVAMLAVTEQVAAMATKAGPPNVVTHRTGGSGSVTTVTSLSEDPPITADVALIERWLNDTQAAVDAMKRIVDRFVRWDPDPELEEKARKWDELRANLMK